MNADWNLGYYACMDELKADPVKLGKLLDQAGAHRMVIGRFPEGHMLVGEPTIEEGPIPDDFPTGPAWLLSIREEGGERDDDHWDTVDTQDLIGGNS